MRCRPYALPVVGGGSGSIGDGAPRPSTLVDWVGLVRDLAERLTTVSDAHEVAQTVSAGIQHGLGASAVVVGVLRADGQGVTTLVAEGVRDVTTEWLTAPLPTEESVAAIAALAADGPFVWSTRAARDRDVPMYAGRPSSAEAWAVLPLLIAGRPIGTISIGWPTPRDFDTAEVAILEVIAHQCALALDRARLDAVRRAERDTLELLNEGTQLMVSALEPERLLEELVHLAVPRLAPWCAVCEADGDDLRRAAIEIQGHRALARTLKGRVVASIRGPHPAAVAFRTGTVQVVCPVDEEVARSGFTPIDAPPVGTRKGPWTELSVPIKSAGDVLGVLTLVSDRWHGQPPDDVRFAAEGLAARAGVALANAWRFEEARRTATTLSGAFLPARLPAIAGYEVAAQYLPAGATVAGDWYDVAALPSGAYLVGIGDAGGHGIEAASLMGQLRNGARSLAMVGKTPGEIVSGLRLLTAHEHPDAFATVSYGLLDPVAHTAAWAVAGHIPVLRFGRGSASYVEGHVELPLGWPSPPSGEHVLALGEGEGVVLVTDGVVERRSSGLDEGMAQLRDVVATHTSLGAAELTDAIVDRFCQSPEDDCCVLVLTRRCA